MAVEHADLRPVGRHRAGPVGVVRGGDGVYGDHRVRVLETFDDLGDGDLEPVGGALEVARARRGGHLRRELEGGYVRRLRGGLTLVIVLGARGPRRGLTVGMRECVS